MLGPAKEPEGTGILSAKSILELYNQQNPQATKSF